MSQKIDPVCEAYLKKVKKCKLSEWQEDEMWKFIRAAVTDKKSPEYKKLNEILLEKLHTEAYLQAHIDNIRFGD